MNKLREQIKDEFLAALKEDRIPWERGWIYSAAPVNQDGRAYHGINRMWLSYVADERGYKDNRWMTFNQAVNKGYKIIKGSEGAKIEFWSLYDKETKKKISYADADKLQLTKDEWKERIVPISSVYTVFNAEQIEGIPPQKITAREQIGERKLENSMKKMLEAMGVKLSEGGDTACYVPSADIIRMPFYENFKDNYSYMATLLHEAAHATGHETRLNRNISNTFGTPDYAREELRAEISSAFVSQSIQLKETGIQNHKAYIQSWIQVLEQNPDELFAAIKDAENIADYLIEKGGLLKSMEKYKGTKEGFIDTIELAYDNGMPVSKCDRAIYNRCIKERYSDISLEEIAADVKKSLKDAREKDNEMFR